MSTYITTKLDTLMGCFVIVFTLCISPRFMEAAVAMPKRRSGDIPERTFISKKTQSDVASIHTHTQSIHSKQYSSFQWINTRDIAHKTYRLD